METPTNPNQPQAPASTFADDGQIKPPQIEWVHNAPATTTHLPTPDSSWLQSLSYDSASLRLTVTTKEGASWQHAQVYPGQFTEMQLHPSKGSYYTKNIKGQHPSTPIKRNPKLSLFPKGAHVAKSENKFEKPTNHRFKIKRRYA